MVRRYGPHQDATVPATVTVLSQPSRRTRPVEEVAPIPKALLRQRDQLNTLAATQGGTR